MNGSNGRAFDAQRWEKLAQTPFFRRFPFYVWICLAAMFGMQLIPMVLSPQCAAAIASGTVDIPAASAPRILAALISAGVSKLGPAKYMYTPSLRLMSNFFACALTRSAKSGS